MTETTMKEFSKDEHMIVMVRHYDEQYPYSVRYLIGRKLGFKIFGSFHSAIEYFDALQAVILTK